eukprot:457645_1
MHCPLKSPATHLSPDGEKVAEVTIVGVCAQSTTLWSRMFHNRIFLSKEPDKKIVSSLGWKATEVTKSLCWKRHKHFCRDTCQSITVRSIDAESKKFARDQAKAMISDLCPE